MTDKFSRKKGPSTKQAAGFANLDAQLREAVEKMKQNQYQPALRLLEKILDTADSHYPQLHLVHFYKGRILQKMGDNLSAEKNYRESIKIFSDYPIVHNNLANLLKQNGQYDEAKAHYEKAINLNSEYVEAYYNFANFYLKIDDKKNAKEMLDKVLLLKPDYEPAIALFQSIESSALGPESNTGRSDFESAVRFKEEGEYKKSIQYFESALNKGYKEPDLFNHYALLLYDLHYPQEDVMRIFHRGIAIHSNDFTLYNNLGHCLMRYHRLDQALDMLEKAIKVDPNQPLPYYCKGFTHLMAGQYVLALEAEKKSVSLDPESLPAFTLLLNAAQHLADWDTVKVYFAKGLAVVEKMLKEKKAVNWDPFAAIMLPFSNEQYRAIVKSQHPSNKDIQPYQSYNINTSKNEKIRIAYISPDLKEAHPVGLLVNTIFSLHDSEQFETFIYGLRDFSDPSAIAIQNSVDHYFSLTRFSDQAAAEKIHNDGIHILVDLAGHTKENRHGILERQPAPIQIQYLGFTASMCCDFIQYHITCRETVPESLEKYFTEKLILMPEGTCSTFLRKVKNKDLQRKDFGLPEKGVVFCCFNTIQRIDETVFQVWMNILKAVPKSVLWLYKENEMMANNLRRFAKEQDVDPERLLFFKHGLLTEDWHHQLADLWLDTFSLSGGTGGVLCANAGLPVITMAGMTAQSRVGAGIAVAAGNTGMICYSIKEYQEKAIDLGLHPEKLEKLKEDLIKKRGEMALFNPQRWIRHLELAYREIWNRYLDGDKPKTISVRRLPHE